MSTGAPTAAPKGGESWTIRGLLGRHKLATSVVAAGIVALLATFVLAAVGSKAGAVSDSTSCTQWGAANQRQQAVYARLYVREHGALSDGQRSPASVITAINNGCTQAYGDDVSDTTTVVQAIRGDF